MIKVRMKRSEKTKKDLFKAFGGIETYEELSRPVVIKEIPQNEEEMQMLSAKDRRIWEEQEQAETFDRAEEYRYENVY